MKVRASDRRSLRWALHFSPDRTNCELASYNSLVMIRFFSKYRRIIMIIASATVVAMIAGPMLANALYHSMPLPSPQPTQVQGELRRITLEALEQMMKNDRKIFVYFRPESCNTCEQPDMLLGALSGLVPNLYTVEVDGKDDGRSFGIIDVPTLVRFEGEAETGRLVGEQSFQDYVTFLGLGGSLP